MKKDFCYKILELLKVHELDWIDCLITGSLFLKVHFLNNSLYLKTDISSPDKSVSTMSSSQQQKIVKPQSEYGIVGESSPPGVGTSGPATCKLSKAFFFPPL